MPVYSQFWLDYANGVVPTPVEFIIRDFIYNRDIDALLRLIEELESTNDGNSDETVTASV